MSSPSFQLVLLALFALPACREETSPTGSVPTSDTETATVPGPIANPLAPTPLSPVALPDLGELPPALETLVAGLSEADVEVRRSSVEALESLGTNAYATIPALEAIMTGDGDSSLRIAAARAVGAIRKAVTEAGGDPDKPPLSLADVAGAYEGGEVLEWLSLDWKNPAQASEAEAIERFSNWLIGSQFTLSERGAAKFAAKGQDLKAVGNPLVIPGQASSLGSEVELSLRYLDTGILDTNNATLQGKLHRDEQGRLILTAKWYVFMGSGHSSFTVPSGIVDFVQVLTPKM